MSRRGVKLLSGSGICWAAVVRNIVGRSGRWASRTVLRRSSLGCIRILRRTLKLRPIRCRRAIGLILLLGPILKLLRWPALILRLTILVLILGGPVLVLRSRPATVLMRGLRMGLLRTAFLPGSRVVRSRGRARILPLRHQAGRGQAQRDRCHRGQYRVASRNPITFVLCPIHL